MYYGDVFSWAEDKNGKMVYIDDVPGVELLVIAHVLVVTKN